MRSCGPCQTRKLYYRGVELMLLLSRSIRQVVGTVRDPDALARFPRVLVKVQLLSRRWFALLDAI